MYRDVSIFHYQGGGIIFEPGNVWAVFAGAMASVCDTLMRLIYQKYQNVAADLAARKIIPPHHEKRTEHEQSASLRVRLEQWPGIGGFLLFFILLAAIFDTLDLIGGAVVMITFCTLKAMKYRNLPMESQK